MAATRTTLKQYFKKYATPTEEQFAALIDAFVHKDEDSLTQSKIDGLTAALESKVSSSDLASAVATAVEETLQGGNIEVTPAAHQHAIADVEGLQAFVTKVNNFLESVDVSDETINRWVEIETFLTGITDQETLAGLLLNLKNEILAQIPEPQTGNYLKQISDLDAYTEAQEGEIVQYVGSTTENYTRALCYERVVLDKEKTIFNEVEYNDGNTYELSINASIKNFCNLNGDKIKIYSPSSQFLSNHPDWAYLTTSSNGFTGLTIPANENPIGKDLYLWQYRNEVYSTKCYSVEYSGENPIEIGSGYTYSKHSDTPYARIVEYDFVITNGIAYVNGKACSNNPQKNVTTDGGVYKADTYGIVIGENNQIYLAMIVAPSDDTMNSYSTYLVCTTFMIPVLALDDSSFPNMEADLTKTYLCFKGPQSETKTVSDFIVCQTSKATIQVPTWQPIATSPAVS